jgi:hypothetical protein
MQSKYKLAVAFVAGVAVSGAVIQRLHAQATPPAYVIVDISDIADPEGFKAILPKSGPETLVPFGGKYIIRTEKIPHSMDQRPDGLLSSVPQRRAGKGLEGDVNLEAG